MVDEVRKVTTRLPDSAIDLLSTMADSSALETKSSFRFKGQTVQNQL